MTYFRDLTKSEYSERNHKVLNVGFLDASHSYQQGVVSEKYINLISRISSFPTIQHRGFNTCNLCTPPEAIKENSDFVDAWYYTRRGSGILIIQGNSGTSYAVPTLLLHYITEHQYQPPDEFLSALDKLSDRINVRLQEKLRETKSAVKVDDIIREELDCS